MLVDKYLQSNKAAKDFRNIEYDFEELSETHKQLGMTGYSVSARIIHRGIQVTKNSKAVSSKDSRNNRENFGVSCNNKIN